jgi:hypothetical protein
MPLLCGVKLLVVDWVVENLCCRQVNFTPIFYCLKNINQNKVNIICINVLNMLILQILLIM